MPRLMITERMTGIGEYCLSIDLDMHRLYIHEMFFGGDWRICTGLFMTEYLAFRDVYFSLKVVWQGILCVNSDYTHTYKNKDAPSKEYSYLSIRRQYLVRKGEKWTIYDVNSVALHSITMTTNELEKIIGAYDQHLESIANTEEE